MLTLALALVCGSCASRDGEQTSDPIVAKNGVQTSEQSDRNGVPAVDEGRSAPGVALRGKVLRKPWSKSLESWNAGGSEYYVLDVGDAQIAHRSAAEGVTLKPTDAVSADTLASMVGKQVEVSGTYVQAKPYQPSQPTEQYPMDMDGKPLPRGAGFAVTSIKML